MYIHVSYVYVYIATAATCGWHRGACEGTRGGLRLEPKGGQCMDICVNKCIDTYVCVNIHLICMWHMYGHMYICACEGTRVKSQLGPERANKGHVRNGCIYVCVYIHIHRYIYVYTHLGYILFIHTYIYKLIYAYSRCVYMHIIYAQICMYCMYMYTEQRRRLVGSRGGGCGRTRAGSRLEPKPKRGNEWHDRYVHVCVNMHIHRYVYVYIHLIYLSYLFKRIYTYAYTHMGVYICTSYMQRYVYTNTCIHM